MEEHQRSRLGNDSRRMKTHNDEVKTTSGNLNKTDEPIAEMPLRKRMNKKIPAKNKTSQSEIRKKPQDSLKKRQEESETDESSSDDRYLEDYSTGDSENDTSGSEGLSQEFSDEDKLMEYYEKKLREHCLVGNIDSCSTDNDEGDVPPDDLQAPSDKPPSTNMPKKPNTPNPPDTASRQSAVGKSIRRPAIGKNQNNKSLLTMPSSRRERLDPISMTGNLENDLKNHDSSSENDEEVTSALQWAEKFGEPSCSSFPNPQLDTRPGKSLETANDQYYDSNKKVIDYLNRMGDKGLTEMMGKFERHSREKRVPYQSRVEGIHNSAKDHILKNYVSCFVNKKDCGTKGKNIRKHNRPTDSTSTSQSELSDGEELTKDEVVDRILTTSISGNTERNLTSLIDMWRKTSNH